MQKAILKLLYKLALLLLPLAGILLLYIILDPFKVMRSYKTYMTPGKPQIVHLNKDYVSTETFLNNYPIYHYDSYIFGNSRSMFYPVADWDSYIHSGKCFHFDAYKESLYGVYLKIKYLSGKQIPIKNALIVLDTNLLEVTGNSYVSANLYMKHPLLSGESRLFFQYQFIKAFCDLKFLIPYIDYKLTAKIRAYVRANDVFDENILGYDKVTNEETYIGYEQIIKHDSARFYKAQEKFFPQNIIARTSIPVIKEKQKIMLAEIKKVFIADHTNYRIIVSPHYWQAQINPADMEFLRALFGPGNVYDFSGTNFITTDKHNFYDGGHYRPQVARYILSVAYSTLPNH
ncbi:MAG: hypothetical protein H0X33_12820 [Taibaiella sp.]|nr:hypothetical protein [Taibaiella sp.]